MFGGIVEGTGKVSEIKKSHSIMSIDIDIGKICRGVKIGDSIAINGACLTVTKKSGTRVSFDIIRQTLKHTNLRMLKRNSIVNVERSLKIGSRLSGHFVTGHIDLALPIRKISQIKKECNLTLLLPKKYRSYAIKQGSITLDGIGLTIADINVRSFAVCIIPHTLRHTNIGMRKEKELINVEFDMLGKYILQK